MISAQACGLLELLPEPALLLHLNGTIAAGNVRFRELVGLSPSECAGVSLFALNSGSREGLGEYLRLCAGVRQLLLGAMSLRTRDGSVLRVRCEGARLSEDGEDSKLLLIRVRSQETAAQKFLALNHEIGELQWEISQRKKAEAALRQSEARLKQAYEARARLAAIVESSEDAIVGKGLDHVVTDWNRGAERMFGYTAEEMIGTPIVRLFPPELVDEETSIMERLQRGERIEHYETVRRCKDGSLLDVSISVSPVLNENGEVIGASRIARDITRQKRTERALAQAQEELHRRAVDLEQRVRERTAELRKTVESLDAFCYTIAHDLRAPLRGLRGFSQLLREEYQDGLDHEGQEHLKRIDAAAEHMDKLVLGLLQLGRLSTAELAIEAVPVDKALRDALLSLDTEIVARQASLDIREPLLPVQANRLLLQQALANLIANALKFGRPGVPPRVEIWTESHQRCVRVLVKDYGMGINPAYLGNLFQPFARLVKREEYPGTGIGLALVRKAAERMAGSVGVETEPGVGSTFWIELPPGAPRNSDLPEGLLQSAANCETPH